MSMSKKLMKNAPDEIRALYDVSCNKKLTNGDCLRTLRIWVRNQRTSLVSTGQDPLKNRENQYGNKGRWGAQMLSRLSRQIFQDKKPGTDDLGQWVSVEIECIFRHKRHEETLVAAVRKAGLSKYVTIKGDGSVHPDEEGCSCDMSDDEHSEDCDLGYGREIVVTFKRNNPEVLRLVCSELNRTKAYVNKTCGLHVHFDCRHISSRSATNRGKRIALAVPALRLMLPKSRQDNQYCASTINKTRGGSRYAFVNMQAYAKHQTIEVRGHSGTTDTDKILYWIDIVGRIMNTRNTNPITTIPEMLSAYDFRGTLAEYIRTRAAKFAVEARPETDDVQADNVVQLPTTVTTSVIIQDSVTESALVSLRTGTDDIAF